jgi:predicted O-methyltransferase YrrM
MSIVRIARKILRTARTPFELSRLRKNENKTDPSLYTSIRSARRTDFSDRELAWIKKIEHQRTQLLETDDTINVDFSLNTDPETNSDENEIEKIRDVCYASVNSSYGSLMHRLVRDFAPKNCLELGTCLGISTAYIASALKLNGTGRLVTLEGSPARSKYAESVLSMMNLPDIDFVVGPFNQTLEPLLEKYQSIDFCYIDGHHDGDATIGYFDKISPVMSDGAIVVIDDITWSVDMKRAWNTIREKQEIALIVDTYMMGICLIKKKHAGTQKKKTEIQSYKIMYW